MACAARAFYPAPRIAPLALLAGQTLILVGGLTASFVLWQALVAGSSESVVPALSLIACLLGTYTIAGLLTLAAFGGLDGAFNNAAIPPAGRSEEHTSELQSLMRISYAVFCLQKKNILNTTYIKYNKT